MKDCIEIFDNKNTNFEGQFCKSSLKVSNVYKKIGELLPVFILTITVIIRDKLFLTNFEGFVVQPIVVFALIIVTYFIYIGFYTGKLKLNDNMSKSKHH